MMASHSTCGSMHCYTTEDESREDSREVLCGRRAPSTIKAVGEGRGIRTRANGTRIAGFRSGGGK